MDYYHWLGEYGQDESPRVTVTYNFDSDECLPEEETETPQLLEECPPELLVFDEADYGDE